ncbi:MAG: hypothetical protein J6D47_11600 [Peptostreptococcaceae bacterium]|nr:hypothetical protein [Peptostreptococcaceae bacterium]
MANIKTHLNNIKGALYGKDVRGSIHDGIDAINKEVENTTGRQVDLENTFDQLVINAGNSNAEIVDARVKSDGTSYSKLGDRLDAVDSQLAHVVKYDVVVGLGCDNTGSVEIGDIIQSFLDDANNENINLYFPPGIYKWNITVSTNKTLFISGERGNVIINNSGDLACLKHNGECSISGLIFNTSSSSRSEFTVYSNNGTGFLCYDTTFTCTSGKINGLHIENTTISHIDRCKFNHSQISLKTWDCKITNTWVWALWRPYGIGIHGGCGNITISNVDVVPPFKTPNGDMSSSELLGDVKAGIWINSDGGNPTNNVIMENIYLDGNPSLYTGVGLACENVFGITLSSFRANKMNDYPIVIKGCYNVIISKGVFFENNKLDLVSKNEILIKNPNNNKCDNITITDNHFINHRTGYTNKAPAIRVDDDVINPVTIKYNKISQQSGSDCAYGNIEITTPFMEDLSTNTGSKFAYKLNGSFVIPSGSTGVSLTLPNFMVIEPSQKHFRFWVDNSFLPSLRVQKNQKNNVWIGVQTAPIDDITVYYEVNI